MHNPFLDVVQVRRSIYALDKKVSKANSDIVATIEGAIAQAPAAFGLQPTRVVVLFNQHHDELWDIVKEKLQAVVPAHNFDVTAQKIKAFKAAYGTVLFFEDQTVIQNTQKQFPLYAANFPVWGLQAHGIALYSIWCALACIGIGASIQHYNPLIDNDVCSKWSIPNHWTLLGQMPFGNVVSPADLKSPIDISTLVKTFE